VLWSRAAGRILNDDADPSNASPLGLIIVSDSTQAGPGDYGRNRLQWVNPPGADAATATRIDYNTGSSCSPPAVGSGTDSIPIPGSPAVGKAEYPHSDLVPGQQYCYTVSYVGIPSAGASRSARPFDSWATPVRWKLFTNTSLMAAPTVGDDAVIAPSNDNYVHALQRDPLSTEGGSWPDPWGPLDLGAIAQHRAPIVPIGGVSWAFIATQDGRVHCVNTATGALRWSTPLPEGSTVGAPAGIFVAGGLNYVLVGTSAASDNRFYALDPETGAVIDVFPRAADNVTGGLGAILGMATVDYDRSRVYFASRRGTAGMSLWCLDLGPSSDALRLGWSRDLGADVDGSPVLRKGRLYVGDESKLVWSIPAATGQGGYSRSVGTSRVKGFLFPDRNSTDLYAATDDRVVGLTDDGSLLERWATPLVAPSIVLLRPGTAELYVGVSNYGGKASLVRIDTATGTVAASVALEDSALTIGAPSLDWEYGVIHVGSVDGVLYAVRLTF
jgi:outer membrane protein assembly factor BamB